MCIRDRADTSSVLINFQNLRRNFLAYGQLVRNVSNSFVGNFGNMYKSVKTRFQFYERAVFLKLHNFSVHNLSNVCLLYTSIPDPFQNPVGHTRCSSGALCHFFQRRLVHFHIQKLRGAPDNLHQFFRCIKLELAADPESIPQRR